MDLSVKIKDVEFRNPVILASGAAGFGRELSRLIDFGKIGGICTKGLTPEPRQGNSSPRVAETPSGILNSVGLQNPGMEYFIAEELPFMRTLGVPIIANIAGGTEDEYLRIAERIDRTDVDMLEMNISCPNVKAGGAAFGIYPEDVKRITIAVRRVVKKPLIVKLSPNVANIADNALAAEEGGADALSLINTLTGMAVDWRARKPVLANVIGGLSGPAIKPVALRMVYQARKAVRIPIVGIGGIMTAEDVMEFLAVGATAVQVGALLLSDPIAAENIAEHLTKLAEEVKLNRLADIIGIIG